MSDYNETTKDILDALIPRSEDGLRNEQCRMFIPANPHDRLTPDMFQG